MTEADREFVAELVSQVKKASGPKQAGAIGLTFDSSDFWKLIDIIGRQALALEKCKEQRNTISSCHGCMEDELPAMDKELEAILEGGR